jgi:hypothetical protein
LRSGDGGAVDELMVLVVRVIEWEAIYEVSLELESESYLSS